MEVVLPSHVLPVNKRDQKRHHIKLSSHSAISGYLQWASVPIIACESISYSLDTFHSIWDQMTQFKQSFRYNEILVTFVWMQGCFFSVLLTAAKNIACNNSSVNSTLGTLMTSAAADVINHNGRKIGRFKPRRFCQVNMHISAWIFV